jgi:hypothetical protein
MILICVREVADLNLGRDAVYLDLYFAVALVSSCRQIRGDYFKLDHDQDSPHPIQIILHKSSQHSTLYSWRYGQCHEDKKGKAVPVTGHGGP